MSARLLNGYWVLAVAGVCLLFSAGAYAVDNDGDGIGDDAETLACQGTVIPDVPTQGLKKNRYALTGNPSNTIFESSNKTVFTTVDTGGCSCTQIIAALGLGSGHTKFGCSKSAMLMWADTVQPAAADDTATVTEDDPATVIDVLANDIPATITAVTQPTNGTVVNNGTDVTYEPTPDYCNDGSPTDDFTYTILGGSPATATVAMTVACVNDAPVITSDGGGATASLNAAENQTAVTTVTATDIDLPAQTLTFTITGGADAALFSIGGASGVLTFNSAPDFENPLDAGGDNVYDVQVTVTDDGAPNLSDVQDIAVTVDDVNDAPVITSDGGGANASVNAAENQTAVTTVTATDEDLPAQTLTFSITGGADQALFIIGGASGVLTFNSAPNFENPLDAGGDNVYDVQVTVTDDGAPNLSDMQEIAVTVTDVNEAPVITSDGGGATASVNVDENTTAVTTVTAADIDVPAQTLTFSITGGADASSFGIVAGVLTFNSAPDFENPTDAGVDNVYDVQVTVTDNGAPNLSDVQDIAVTVDDVVENEAPVITSDGGGATASLNADENQTAVTTVTATDADVPSQTLTFTISGGADAALFGIVGSTGVLTFNGAPDFETPLDAGGDNDYEVEVTVTDDGIGTLTDVQAITVTVDDVNEAPVITSDGGGATASVNAAENQTAVTVVTATDVDVPAQTLTFSISGGADAALFGIVGSTGVLTFNSAPDFENPTDAGGNNVYNVQVTVTDDGAPNLSDAQDIAVTVDDVGENAAPVITSDGGGATASINVDENQTAVTTVTATDADAGDILTFSISGGADAGLFGIVGGVLTFNSAPDFENAQDAGGDNVYNVQVTVTDDGAPNLSDVQDIAVTVDNVNDAPSDIALDNSNVDENEPAATSVGTFTTTDMDPDTHTYSLVSGTGDADNGAFTIVGTQLQTAAVLNFEAATNCTTSATTCSIRVQTNDGNGGSYSEAFIISINNVNDAPVAVNDPYSGAIGNVSFELVAAASGSTPVPPSVQVVGTIVSNDTDEDTADTLNVTANGSIPTTQGGTAAIDANGRFVYSPATGFPGSGVSADQFTYEVCDNAGAPLCDTGTVTISGTNIVWFVDDSSPNNPGTGTGADPFRDLSSASGAPTAPGETIFVYAGTQTTGITLQDNQQLLGEGSGLVVNTTTLVDAGAPPVIANAGGTAITLGMSNTIRGLDITGSVSGIVGTNFGTLTASDVAIGTTNAALDLTSGTGNVNFDIVSSTLSSAEGVYLDTVTGIFNLGIGAIMGSTGTGFRVTSSSATVNYDGTINTAASRPVDISGQFGGAVTFGGAIATTTGDGVRLSSNTGGTITFRGGLNLITGTGAAFDATAGGTVNVCADDNCETAGGTSVSNTVATTIAKGINIQNATIGAGGVTFDDVEVDGGSAGIDIENAGSGGFFTVNGGLIENTTVNGILIENTDNITISNVILNDAALDGGAGCSTTIFSCRAAVEFNTVSTIDMSDVTIMGSGEHGIFGTNVTDLDLTNVSVEDAGQTSEEHGIFIRNLLGTLAAGTDSVFDNVDITNSGSNGIFVENTTGTTALEAQPDLLTIRNGSSVTFNSTNSAIIVETDAAAANLKLDVQTGTVLDNNPTRGISANANTGRLQFTATGVLIGQTVGSFTGIGGGSAGAGADSELILNLTNNTITQAGTAGTGPSGIAFSSFSTGADNGTMRGTIQGNTIGSASNTVGGINLTNEGNSTANRFLIDSNTITFPAGGSSGIDGMRLQSRTGQGAMDLILTNNVISIPNNTDDFTGGIVIFSGNQTLGEANTVCVKMALNDVNTPAKDATHGSEHEYAIIGWAGNTVEIDSFAAEGIPVTDAGIATYVSPAPAGVNIAGNTSVGLNTGVQIVGGTLLDGTCVAP